jgi:hypothetical protein
MKVYNAIVLFTVIILIVIFVPMLLRALQPRNKGVHTADQNTGVLHETQPASVSATKEQRDIDYKRDIATKIADAMYLPVQSTKAEKQLTPDDNMISTYYTNSVNDVPEQYCRKPIGACPDSKKMSEDLPIGNIPMCMAVQPNNMRLKV